MSKSNEMSQEHEADMELLREVLEETRGMDRRAFLSKLSKAAAGSALLAGIFAEPLRAFAAGEPVNIMTWGGAWRNAVDNAISKPFTAETGVGVRYIGGYDFPKLLAMFQAKDQQADIVLANGIDTTRIIRLGMNAPLDFSVVDRSQLTPNQLKNGGVGGIAISTLLVYSKKKWPGADHPNSWADFWDIKKYPGARSMLKRVFGMLEAALMADGVAADPAKIYPIDADRAFRKLDQIKPHIRAWWSTGTDIQQMIQDGEIDLAPMWNGRASDSIVNNKANFGLVWNQAILDAESDAWFPLKNSPNPAGAQRYLNVVGRPEVQAAIARVIFYAPQNLNAYKFLDPEISKHQPSYPENAKISFPIDYTWWADNYDALHRRFDRWLQS